MIAIDTSALIAIALEEPEADACRRVIAESEVVISAGTLAETLIVAGRRNLGLEMDDLLAGLAVSVQPVTEATARRMARAYSRWGKGVHSAKLNLGDCFAYAVAEEHGCPLLYVGNDFAQTDIPRAQPPLPT